MAGSILTSMTGFGRAQAIEGELELNIEIRSVNHRFLDLSFRLPGSYSALEPQLGKIVREYVRRGRLDITVIRTSKKTVESKIQLNEQLFLSYLNAVKGALKRSKVQGRGLLPDAALQVLLRREVLDLVEDDIHTEQESPTVEKTLRAALADLVTMRRAEGAGLEKELRSMLKSLAENVETISGHAEAVSKTFHDRLRARLEKLTPGVNVEPERLAQEVAILADRTDITEELARLRVHISGFLSLFGDAESGKKLDFLIQEMGREINTIGSKSQNADIAMLVVSGKSFLEKIREQVQNVE